MMLTSGWFAFAAHLVVLSIVAWAAFCFVRWSNRDPSQDDEASGSDDDDTN